MKERNDGAEGLSIMGIWRLRHGFWRQVIFIIVIVRRVLESNNMKLKRLCCATTLAHPGIAEGTTSS